MLNDMLEACRLCMCREKDNMKPIFDQQSLATKIMWISDLKMFDGDNLPAQICQQCYVRVNSAFYFKEQIIGIDRTLREMMGQNMDIVSDSIPSTSPEKSGQEVVEVNVVNDASETECYEASNYDQDTQEFKIEAIEASESVVVDLDSDLEEAESDSSSEKDDEEYINYKVKWNFQKRKKPRRRDRNFLRQTQKPHKRGGKQLAPLKCPICSKILHSNLARHVKRHYEEGSRVYKHDINGILVKEQPEPATKLETMADPDWVIANGKPQTTTDSRTECPICGKVVTNATYLKMHMHSHNSERSTVQCVECSRVFYNAGNLRIHMTRVHGAPATPTPPPPGPATDADPSASPAAAAVTEPDEKGFAAMYPCDQCSGIFSSSSNLRNHVRAIHEFDAMTPTSFSCEMCELTFNVNSALQNHVREAHDGAYVPKPYRCDRCPLAFTLKASLLGHTRTHSQKASYPCNQCDMTFSKTRILNEHRKTHVSQQLAIYPCTLCDKSFTNFKFYTAHRRNHDLDKRFNCEMCPKLFYEQSSLVRHLRISHDVSTGDDGSEDVAIPVTPEAEEGEIVACPVATPPIGEDAVMDVE